MLDFVWIVTRPNYIHSQACGEFAMTVRDACAALGHDCKIVTSPPPGESAVLVMCANLLPPGATLPSHFIIYQMEQISPESRWISESYLSLLKRHVVWDYSPLNIANLEQLGVRADLCEVGYMPCLTEIPSRPKEIDVLFIGSQNDRRLAILRQLAERGVKVRAIFGEYGQNRTEALARSRISLNIHYYDAKIFEIFRCSYFMANRQCIVSERGLDRALEDQYAKGIAFVPYDQLAEKCLQLLSDEKQRKRIAQAGFDIFSRKSQVDILKRLKAAKS